MAERGNTIDDAGIRRLNEMSRQLGKRHPRTTHGRRRRSPVIVHTHRAWYGVLTADLSSGSSATFQRKKWNGSNYENVGEAVDCRAETTFDGGPIPSTTEGAVEKRDGEWWLIRVYWCPAS